MRLLSLLRLRRCSHTWIFFAGDGREPLVKRRHCIDCGKVEDVPPGQGAASGMGWGHGGDAGGSGGGGDGGSC